MISKRFVKLDIFVYYKYNRKYEVKIDSYNFSLLFAHI